MRADFTALYGFVCVCARASMSRIVCYCDETKKFIGQEDSIKTSQRLESNLNYLSIYSICIDKLFLLLLLVFYILFICFCMCVCVPFYKKREK